MKVKAVIAGGVIAASALQANAQAPGQDIVERREGVICQLPECNVRRSLPVAVDSPTQAQEFLVEHLQTTPASALDPALPPIAFEDWLSGTLDRHAVGDTVNPTRWHLTSCDERRSAIPRPGPNLCVEVSRQLSAIYGLMIVVEVAEGATALDNPKVWRVHEPVIRSVYVERSNEEGAIVDSLDLPSLGGLESPIFRPDNDWPAADFKSDITWAIPPRWKRGDPLTFTISVENVGSRDADRAIVNVVIGVPVAGEEHAIEVRRDWYPRIPAHDNVRFNIEVRLPLGRAIATVSVEHGPGPKAVVESNPDDNDTTKFVFIEAR